jgi:Domain of unknown function (DUF6916)
LKLCGGTLIAAQVDPVSLLAGADALAAAATQPVAATPLHASCACAAHFRQHVDSTFVVGSEHGPIPVLLAKVIERSPDPRLEQFSLVFHTDANGLLSEGSHRFHHPVLGDFDLYIAPTGAASNRPARLEACFSRPATTPVSRTGRYGL